MAAEALPAADEALVERALREAGASTDRPGLGAADYFFDLGQAVARGVGWLLESLIDAAGGAVSADFLIGVVGIVFALAVLLLVFLLLRLWLARPPRPAPVELAQSAAPALPPGTDWEAEVESRLARGEIRPALEALWWWLADRLAERRAGVRLEPGAARSSAAEPSWTTRELVQRAGRRDLLRLVTPLDRFLYAGARPSADDVRTFFGQLRGELGGKAAEAGGR